MMAPAFVTGDDDCVALDFEAAAVVENVHKSTTKAM
jgi:hypothetical protein